MEESNTTTRILRLPCVQNKTGLSRSSIYERMQNGEFPPNINLGGKSVGWLEAEVDAWINKQVNKRALVSLGGHDE